MGMGNGLANVPIPLGLIAQKTFAGGFDCDVLDNKSHDYPGTLGLATPL
jgi:hypothetical protein